MNLSSMKPFQVILLAIFGFLAVLGLVLFANFGGFSSAAKLGTVTIWGTLPAQSAGAMIDSLKAGNQDYAGVSYVQKPADSFDAALADALASGTGPDLILISQERLISEQNKLSVIPFSTISQRTYLDTYLPIDELFLSTTGTYGIPLAVDPLVLYYNRATLTSAGIPLPPTSWESVTGLAQQLTQSQGGTVTRSTIPFGVYENVGNARAILSLLFMQAGNSITSVGPNGAHAQLTNAGANSGAVSPAESALNFYTQFADPVKSVYTWNGAISSARDAFLAGNLALYPGFASELPALKAANPNLDFDMVPIPQPQTSTQKITYGLAYAFAIPKASKNPTGALTVAQALADVSRAASTAQTLFMAPATRSGLVTSNTDRYQPIYFPQALIARGWLSPSPSKTDQIFGTMIENVTSGRLGAGEALSTANQAIDASL